VSGIAIECATERADVVVRDAGGAERSRVVEEIGRGHTRRVAGLMAEALERAGLAPAQLRWIAVDLGPGSFTGVRVGLATAQALSLASGAKVLGASSLSALAYGSHPAHSSRAGGALVVPIVPAGRAEAYAGFHRADTRGAVRLVAAPRVRACDPLLAAIREARDAAGLATVLCVGPGVPRWREAIESAFPGSTHDAWRFEGLSSTDLADAALSGAGPAAGLPAAGQETRLLYVRSAQAEERVRHRVAATDPAVLRPMESHDVPAVAAIETRVFSDPWPASFFLGELSQPRVYARVAERGGTLAGYSVALLDEGAAHLGNLAVAPEARLRGVATALLRDLLARASALGVSRVALEVRVSNFAAQALYRAHGFRLAGLRRGYYRDTSEDALVMEWCKEGN